MTGFVYQIIESGLDLTSADAFAYSFGKSIAASAASFGVGKLASEAGLGGFVSTIAASLTGMYVNTELLSLDKGKQPEDQKLPAISINSSISYNRNGKGFRAESIDFDLNIVSFEKVSTDINDSLKQIIVAVKSKMFGEALDNKISTNDVVKQSNEIERIVLENKKRNSTN